MDKRSHEMGWLKFTNHVSKFSVCNKRKVGCVVTNGKEFVIGINHSTTEQCTCNMHTKNPDVIHAEKDALSKIDEAETLYVSYTPCENCQKLMVAKGITKLVTYGNFDSEYLSENGVHIVCYNEQNKP